MSAEWADRFFVRDFRADRFIQPLISDFAAELQHVRCVCAQYLRDVRHNLREYVAAIAAEKLDDWQTEALARGLAQFPAGTRKQRYVRAAAFGFSEWLRGLGLIGCNPVAAIPVPPLLHEGKIRPFTPAEFLAIVDAVPERFRPERQVVYATAALTGIRQGELRGLWRGDVLREERLIHLRPEITKNGKEAWVPIFPELLELLAQVVEIDQWRDAEPLFQVVPRTETLYRDMRRAGVRRETAAGKVRFHSLRHTFASALSRDVEMPLVQELMRHGDMATTAGYIHTVNPALRAAIDSSRALRAYLPRVA